MRATTAFSATASLLLFGTLSHSAVQAATCRSLVEDYRSVREQQISMAQQIGTAVFTPLKQKSCPPAALTFLDSYIAVLQRLVALHGRAYPCSDHTGRNAPIPGTHPREILDRTQSVKSLCVAYRNAAPTQVARPNAPVGGGSTSCSDISGLGGPRIECPKRTFPTAVPPPQQRPAMAQPRQQNAQPSNNAQAAQVAAINDAISQLGRLGGGGPADAPSAIPPGDSTRDDGATPASPPQRGPELQLPLLLRFLNPQTARAYDEDWKEDFKRIKFSPSAFDWVKKNQRKLLRPLKTCGDIFNEHCLPACEADVESCKSQSAKMKDGNDAYCGNYNLSSCQPLCGTELTECSKGKQ
jgi:hypothetical protein